MRKRLFYTAMVIAALSGGQAWAKDVTVLELFTSQGCSSCPPADRMMGVIANKPEVIALSCHVTYWDRPGWRDSLGQELCTARQNEYAYKLGGEGRIYTPQIVANGESEFVGSRPEEVIKALNGKTPGIDLSLEGGALKMALPQLVRKSAGEITLLLFAYEKSRTQKIGGGENAGIEVQYTNAVTSMTPLGAWNGAAQSKVIQIDKPVNANTGYAVLAQDNETGRILAGGKI